MTGNTPYTGRFAPSPTGPLHFGSLLTAVASYLDARARQGQWLVRMDDLDQPRCVAGADSDILRTLEAYGLHWDGEVIYQSRRTAIYAAALQQLQAHGHAYACTCSRKEIADIARAGIDGPVYPGTCRDGLEPGKEARSIRVRTTTQAMLLQDRIQGKLQQNLQQQVGDFIVQRADGLFAYQLAVVVDDAAQQVTDIVRGCDLLDSTHRQLWLQQLLHYPQPHYAHLPVAVNAEGQKLSKQSHAPPVDTRQPLATLRQVLRFLGQDIPTGSEAMTLVELRDEAIARWRPERIPAVRQQASPLDREHDLYIE